MKWVVIWIIIFLVLVWPFYTRGEPIQEPAFANYKSWEPHRSLGVVLSYEVDGRNIEFAHPVVFSVPAPECLSARLTGTVWSVLVLGDLPMRYQIRSYATAYRYPPGEWMSVIKRTVYEKGSQGKTETKAETQAE